MRHVCSIVEDGRECGKPSVESIETKKHNFYYCAEHWDKFAGGLYKILKPHAHAIRIAE